MGGWPLLTASASSSLFTVGIQGKAHTCPVATCLDVLICRSSQLYLAPAHYHYNNHLCLAREGKDKEDISETVAIMAAASASQPLAVIARLYLTLCTSSVALPASEYAMTTEHAMTREPEEHCTSQDKVGCGAQQTLCLTYNPSCIQAIKSMLITVVPMEKRTCMHECVLIYTYTYAQPHELQRGGGGKWESDQPYKHAGQQYASWMKLKRTPRRKAVANMQ